ncbi:hypothetical protein [Bacillus sp. PS06]|uniref:hypothetical protein n=1 Tax=Bacillus sp. PS06 TaxID=2764176 RepID=UPI00177D0F64|nr:hypothetical protein [Bacillus sp. PS06]MBD8071572.1 hypothetical protein [Bacillus sp. PS06]
MKKKTKIFSCVMMFIVVATFLVPTSKPLATSWAYPFVVWEGYVYVVSDEEVTEVGEVIGKVTRYSDMESFPGNFSNAYEKGTKYYSIEGVSTEEAIAIEQSKGEYLKAQREAEYGVKSVFERVFDGPFGIGIILALVVIGVIAIISVYKTKRR